MESIILIGNGGHAKSVADTIEREKKFKIIGYVDLKEGESKYQYLGTDDDLIKYFEQGIKNVALGIGYLGKSNIRLEIYNKLKKIGFNFPIIKDPSAIISDSCFIDEGVFVGKGAIINTNARIGKLAIINTKALIEHDCIVSDFVHVAVCAVLCGNVQVKKFSFIGANATLIQGVILEEKGIVPAGVVVR